MTDASANPGTTRRRLLRSGAAVAGMAAASTVLPANVRKAIAAPAKKKGRIEDIEHVVLLMQENRSFDHYFGSLSGVRGFSDPHAARISNGKSVFYQPDPSNPDGYLLPYHLDSHVSAAQTIPSLSHAWQVQHNAWNNGAMDNFVPAHVASNGAVNGRYTMGYFTRDDLPFHYALADAFTICDNYHCSVLGPTHPNRYMWMTGTIDPNGEHGGPALDNGEAKGAYTWPTYAEQLEAAGVSWKFYHETVGCTGLALIQNMKQFQDAAKDPTSPLNVKGLTAVPTGQFEYDALNDKLPTVSWLMPPVANDEHPARMPAAGAQYIASKIDAIAANPDVWAKTVFILSYDENDGLFDHVTPPTPKPGTPDEFVTKTSATGVDGGGLPIGPGFRVPCVIVSPWTVGGYVASEPFDHTSQLRFLEQVTGVMATNISQWRRQNLGDLTSAFNFDRPGGDYPGLPDTNRDFNLAQYEAAQFPLPVQPTTDQVVPRQEPGKRKHTN
ncbi:alkaline phosphatase family protein [Rugosimonospora africana]|uniref:phospholipase C n=1 Tax=Rugosimonospora africana TaxID=556532 RepID=A0A8J3QSA1_9ACTN|nr:alkaline phosphatase family protein [Rugosimonospora africana]GIH15769.1 putative non-hemolytic phospholipase C [Rugosimonospora africana]